MGARLKREPETVRMRQRDPSQLELFPTAVRLVRCTPERNQNRFYLMMATPTLFGDWALVREWGRRGSPGRTRQDPHRSLGEAITALLDLRERVVRTVEAGLSRRATAARFEGSVSFVIKLMQRWRQRGTLEPDQYGGWKQNMLAAHAAVSPAQPDFSRQINEISSQEVEIWGTSWLCPA